MTVNITRENLRHFSGSENMFYHPIFRGINYTDGVKHVSDNGAAWLITEILIAMRHVPELRAEEFVTIDLNVNLDKKSAVIVYGDGNDHTLHKKEIPYTDFPLDTIRFFCTNNVLMLASEY